MNATLVSFIAFAAIFGGALGGVWLARRLPQHHLSIEARTAVSVSMAVVGTLAALVLSLMITNANASFNGKSDAVASLAVEIVKLDRTLRRYGPESASARDALRSYMTAKVRDLSGEQLAANLGMSTLLLLEQTDDRVLALQPDNDRQVHLKGDALSVIRTIADSRWTLVAKAEGTMSSPFITLLIFWMSLLFASFGLFAPRNATVVTVLLVSGLAIAGGIFMILELGSATDGLVRISVNPLKATLAELDDEHQ